MGRAAAMKRRQELSKEGGLVVGMFLVKVEEGRKEKIMGWSDEAD